MKKRYEFLIFGKVQGVGFRRFVKYRVDKLNEAGEILSGNVCNLSDGSVRVIAQGEEGTLEKLYQILESGPIKSEVERIQSHQLDIDESLKDFEILK
ncbi:acylphosphatase [Helicobacter sp. MIT 21-1697]|uniref:acylphosphatase n=1 Tax=Helicobacter sp. MIT 21-1697 TaxID=2993733 RepID=UPI00224B6946|nr:acylphosphatase [Helicobacter sp. MIT 21-1697]MCX2717573.1 acylphosphatase [Helicobacter sp. MIT 21-1697]